MTLPDEVRAVMAGERRYYVVHANCLDVLPLLAERSVDHVITDPPYEAEAHTLQRQVKVEGGGGDYGRVETRPLDFAAMDEATREASAAEICRTGRRWALLFCQAEGAHLWRRAMSRFDYIRTGIWVKRDGQPQLSGDRPGVGYESIAIFHPKGRKRWNGGGSPAVWDFLRYEGDGKHPHPTTKPIALMLELVSLFTDPDELILDPFAGSGTTGVACLRLGRRFIGIEKDERYAALAVERLEAESRGLSLKDARAGQLSLLEPNPK